MTLFLRIRRALLPLLIVVGILFWVYANWQHRLIAKQWQHHLDATGNLPEPARGEVVVRTVATTEKNHWKVHIRCGDNYRSTICGAKGDYHPTKLEPASAFHRIGIGQRNKVSDVARGNVFTADIRLFECSDGSWDLICDWQTRSIRINLGDIRSVEDKLRFTGLEKRNIVSNENPIRLVDVIAGKTKTGLISGACFLLELTPGEPISSENVHKSIREMRLHNEIEERVKNAR